MRKLLFLCGVMLCLSLTAVAQDATEALEASSSPGEPAAPVTFTPENRDAWQLGVGYQYQGYNVLGQTFHNHGFNTDLTRYFTNWFGIEGIAAMGYGGNTGAPLNLDAKSLFLGGGPRLAVHNNSRLEPWVHFLVGWEHFRFTQTGLTQFGVLGSNSSFGFMAGGGLDYKFSRRFYWRVQADYIGTHFNSAIQSNYSAGTGLVFNF